MTDKSIQQLRTWVDECAPGRMVFFGGAGVSTESGIPDFRSPDGLYAQKGRATAMPTCASRPRSATCSIGDEAPAFLDKRHAKRQYTFLRESAHVKMGM